MGGSSWSDDHYADRTAYRSAHNVPVFSHDADVRSGRASGVHKQLDPKGVTRESRDSDAHPNSVAIGVMFDVTGSMSSVPKVLQEKLPQLMGLLLRKGYVQDPQILFGAVGDYFADTVPLQVGQFESGIEMDEDIGKIFLEGGGGGQNTESYIEALYFFARHTSIDCWEKRGHKGYLFLLGDEQNFSALTKKEAADVFGDTVEGNVPLAQLVAEVQEKYHVFFLIPGGTNHAHEPALKRHWQEVVGAENVIALKDPAQVCEAVAAIIGMVEGTANADDIATDLTSAGVDAKTATAVAKAVDPLAKSAALVRSGTGNLPEKAASESIERL